MPGPDITVAIIGVVLNALLLVVVVVQLRAANRANREDHDRRKKQATIEWYATTLEQRAKYVDRLPQDRDHKKIAAFLKKVDGRANLDIIGYLNVHEALATAVNMNIHDIDVIERLSGSRIQALYRSYRPWILQREAELQPGLYPELETLVRRLDELPAERRKTSPFRRRLQRAG